MKISVLIIGLLFLAVGSVFYYICYDPKTKKKFFMTNANGFIVLLSDIFIMLGWLSILSFCFGIDGSYMTPSVIDDMTWKNGVGLALSILSLSYCSSEVLVRIKSRCIAKSTSQVESEE